MDAENAKNPPVDIPAKEHNNINADESKLFEDASLDPDANAPPGSLTLEDVCHKLIALDESGAVKLSETGKCVSISRLNLPGVDAAIEMPAVVKKKHSCPLNRTSIKADWFNLYKTDWWACDNGNKQDTKV